MLIATALTTSSFVPPAIHRAGQAFSSAMSRQEMRILNGESVRRAIEAGASASDIAGRYGIRQSSACYQALMKQVINRSTGMIGRGVEL